MGFTFSGWLNPWLGLGIVMVCGLAFVVTHNEAMSMLLQALGYGLLIWRAHSDGHPGALAWLVSVVAVIGLVNRKVFWERSLPTFLGGLGLPSGRGRSE